MPSHGTMRLTSIGYDELAAVKRLITWPGSIYRSKKCLLFRVVIDRMSGIAMGLTDIKPQHKGVDMKKVWIMVLVVAVTCAFAFTVSAKESVKIKEKAKISKDGTEKTKTVVKEKGIGKEVIKTKTSPDGDLKVHDVSKFKHGDLWKDDVKFHHWDKDGDYMYVINDKKTYRVKVKKNAKSPGLKLKKGQTINIVSTYPLAAPELQHYITVSKIEHAQKK